MCPFQLACTAATVVLTGPDKKQHQQHVRSAEMSYTAELPVQEFRNSYERNDLTMYRTKSIHEAGQSPRCRRS